MRHTLIALLTLAVAGCGADSESDSGAGTASENKSAEAPTFGKTDAAFGVVEAGRFGVAGSAEGRFDGGAVRSYRINSYGNTMVRISLTSPGIEVDSYIVIDGPMPGGDGQVVAYNDDDVRGAASHIARSRCRNRR
ncbi:MAG: hypothetical protein ACI9OJ_004037 [Myxococcota bacterium]|jgi:hypothetical protein